MNRSRKITGLLMFAPIFAGAAPWRTQAQDSSNKDQKIALAMAPLDRYLMVRDAEIALASSAAPEALKEENR